MRFPELNFQLFLYDNTNLIFKSLFKKLYLAHFIKCTYKKPVIALNFSKIRQ